MAGGGAADFGQGLRAGTGLGAAGTGPAPGHRPGIQRPVRWQNRTGRTDALLFGSGPAVELDLPADQERYCAIVGQCGRRQPHHRRRHHPLRKRRRPPAHLHHPLAERVAAEPSALFQPVYRRPELVVQPRPGLGQRRLPCRILRAGHQRRRRNPVRKQRRPAAHLRHAVAGQLRPAAPAVRHALRCRTELVVQPRRSTGHGRLPGRFRADGGIGGAGDPLRKQRRPLQAVRHQSLRHSAADPAAVGHTVSAGHQLGPARWCAVGQRRLPRGLQRRRQQRRLRQWRL